jgi:hypothetical protein
MTTLEKQGFIVGPQFTSTGQPLFDETAGKPLVINPKIPALIMDGFLYIRTNQNVRCQNR